MEQKHNPGNTRHDQETASATSATFSTHKAAQRHDNNLGTIVTAPDGLFYSNKLNGSLDKTMKNNEVSPIEWKTKSICKLPGYVSVGLEGTYTDTSNFSYKVEANIFITATDMTTEQSPTNPEP